MRSPLASAWNFVANTARSFFGLPLTDRRLIDLLGLAGSRTASGEMVNADTAMALPAYFACVRVLGEDVAKLPFQVFRRGDSREVADDHLVYTILHDSPNDETTAMSLRESMTSEAASRGASFAEIERNGAGGAIALHKLKFEDVSIDRDSNLNLVYLVAGSKEPIPDRNIFHLHGLGRDSITGLSVAEYAAESIGLGLAQQKYGAALYGNGATPAAAIELAEADRNTSEETLTRIRKSWEDKYKGAHRAGKVAFLLPGMKITPLQINPKDAEFIIGRQFTVEEICRWFRMPPHKIQHLLRSTNNNIEHQSIEYVTDTLHPWLVRWEQEANRKLFTPTERKTLYAEHNLDALLRGDSAARGEFYSKLWGIGVLSINEIRKKENLPAIGPDGDKRFIPVNMISLDRADEIAAVNPPANDPAKTNSGNDPNQAPDPTQNKRRQQIVASMRGLLATGIDSALRVEINEARRKATKPDKFIDWHSASYGDGKATNGKHEALVRDAVLPACRTWVIWSRCEEGSGELAERIAREHCARSRQELDTATQVTADQFEAAVEKVLESWDGRATAEAEAFFADPGDPRQALEKVA